MSVESPIAVRSQQEAPLPDGLRSILYYLTDEAQRERADPNQPATVSKSISEISENTGINRRWVQRGVVSLESRGFLKIERSVEAFRRGRGHLPNTYTIVEF